MQREKRDAARAETADRQHEPLGGVGIPLHAPAARDTGPGRSAGQSAAGRPMPQGSAGSLAAKSAAAAAVQRRRPQNRAEGKEEILMGKATMSGNGGFQKP